MDSAVHAPSTEALDRYLERKITEYGYPGVAVCIRGPEGIVFEKGYGCRRSDPFTPVDCDTIFGIASMSKSMTALSCCILQLEGKLDLDDPVVKYFPDLHIPDIPDECLTIRHLALHRAGIPPIEPLEWSIAMNSVEPDTEIHKKLVTSSPNRMDSIEDIVSYINEARYGSLCAPGEYMSYSNECYALLSYIVDRAAGIPLEIFLKEKIFEPLGMTRTVLDLDGSEARAIASDNNITDLFERDESGKLYSDTNFSILPPFRGCACVKSTAHDMAKYYQALSYHGKFEGSQVIPEEAVELLIGKEYPLKRKPFYCMGLRKCLCSGKIICEHQGGLHGTSTHGGFVGEGWSSVVLCNLGGIDPMDLQWACYNFILGQPLDTELYWAKPSGSSFSRPDMLCGSYIAHEGLPVTVRVYKEDGELKCENSGMIMILRHCEKAVFAVYDADNPQRRTDTYRFYIRDGAAAALKCGSRIYTRVRNIAGGER